jgi:hypothetical protein
MRYPSSRFMVLYNAYRIVRQGGPTGEAGRRVLYFVQRPDGSECCRDTPWAMAERAIRRDMRERDWPTDSLPPGLAAEINTGPRIPCLSIPEAPATKTLTGL